MGFTMLEVLISMVIIAFGLLGVAGLQAFALKNNQSASFRSTAILLTADISDRMRANYIAAAEGSYNQPSTSAYTTAVGACVSTAGCTPQQLAANDLFEWQARVAATLPAGVGIVCLDGTPNDGDVPGTPLCNESGGNVLNYVVKIWWQDNRNRGASSTPQRLSTPFNP